MAVLLSEATSPFERVSAMAEWIHERYGRFHALSPKQLAEALSAIDPSHAMAHALETDARHSRTTKG